MWRRASRLTFPCLAASLILRGSRNSASRQRPRHPPGRGFFVPATMAWSKNRARSRSAPTSTTTANNVTFGFWPPMASRRTVPRRPDANHRLIADHLKAGWALARRPTPPEIPPQSCPRCRSKEATLGHVTNRLQAICGKCGATVDAVATSDEFSVPPAWTVPPALRRVPRRAPPCASRARACGAAARR